MRDGALHRRDHRIWIGRIGLKGQYLAAELGDLLADRLGARAIAGKGEGHMGA